jgi:hypothetical protein
MPTEAPPAPPVAPTAPAPAPSPATDGGPGTEIHVTPTTVDKGPKQEPPKKGSAMDRVISDLRKKAKPQFFESAPESPPAQSPKEGEAPTPSPTEPKAAGEAPAPAAPAAEPEKKTKNPWKLVDEYKARAAKAETDLIEARKSGLNPEERKALDTQLSELRKANEELEKEIRFVNYSKSTEFKTKYQQPYEKAWERAAKEVSEIRINDPETGEQRAATTADLYKVVVAPLNDARDMADAVFGKFADDVMQYRKEIRALNDAQESALKAAQEASIARDKQAQEQNQTFLTKTAGEIKQIWDQANHEFGERADLAFIFKPAETDQEHKSRLEKGYQLVDKAFAINSADPRLTPEQRAEAVKMHAAVRMRAAGFGPLRAKYDALQKQYQALENELKQYKETVPPTGGTSGPDNSPAKHSSGWDNIRAGLQKIAKPV